jgi:hypothetical protein
MTETRFRRAAIFSLAWLVIAVAAAPAVALDAEEILREARERYEARLQTIKAVTIVQETMGVTHESRLEKVMVEDQPQLGGTLSSTYRHFDAFADHATVEGEEEIDGHPCWLIEVTELRGSQIAAEGAGQFKAEEGTFCIDQQLYVVRRLRVKGTAMRQREKTPLTMEIHLADYREVDGWLHPFLTELSLAGEGQGQSDDIKAMQQGMAALEKHMEQMDPEQRAQLEGMMKGRVPALDSLTTDGELKTSVTVTEIRVERE